MRYFKIDDQATVAAFVAFNRQRAQLLLKSRKFAEQFALPHQVQAMFHSHNGALEFAGLVFNPVMQSAAWTRPTRLQKIQQVRPALPKSASKELVREHAQLLQLWQAGAPTESVSLEAVYNAMGLPFVHGLVPFKIGIHDGCVYFATQGDAPRAGEQISATQWAEVDEASSQKAAKVLETV